VGRDRGSAPRPTHLVSRAENPAPTYLAYGVQAVYHPSCYEPRRTTKPLVLCQLELGNGVFIT